MLPLLLLLTALTPLSYQQCLTQSDEVGRVSDKAAESLLQSERRFSADLLHTVTSIQPDQNVFFSPSSVYKALLLAYFISANNTESGLRKVLHLGPQQDKYAVYESYSLQKQHEKSLGYQLVHVNHLYMARHLYVRSCVKALLRDELYLLGFHHPKHTTRTINAWMLMKTKNAFEEDFLLEDQLRDNAKLVLVNAAYIKGKWKHQFKAGNTNDRDFHLNDGTSIKTPMMTQQNYFKFTVDEKLSADVVELPYEGDDISMFMLKPLTPSPTAVKELLKQFDQQVIQGVVKTVIEASPVIMRITIPKFTVEKALDLREVLETMGVTDLFQASADLTTLSGDRGLSISEAVHKAKLRVNEVGTEAAAPNGHNGLGLAAHHIFVADHPFVYFLYDKKSSLVLFLGVFNYPE